MIMKDSSEVFIKMRELQAYNSRMDLHMHTNWTDGENTISEMIKKADLNGLTRIAITDHIRRESDYYSDYIESVKKVSQDFNLDVYCGFEAKILNSEGDIDIPEMAYNQADIVVASVHRIPWGEKYINPKEINHKELIDIELELALSAICNKRVNVIGHSGGMSISTYGTFPEEYFERIIVECERQNVAFEFNYKYHSKYENVLKELLYKYNPYVSLGSDAHNLDRISNRSFYYGQT